MRNIHLFIGVVLPLFLFTGCNKETHETKTIKTFKNPINSYMDSRINAMESAKKAVTKNNQHTKKQNEAIEKLMK